MGVYVAMAVFIVSHVLISRSGLKPWAVHRFGYAAYIAIYSIVSLALFAWVILEVINADKHVLWTPPAWAYVFAAALSFTGFALVGIGITTPNPLSISFRAAAFDPQRPGIIPWIRHPILWGLSFWGVAHIPANGEWPTLILFAGSAVFGLLGMMAVDARQRKKLGPARWTEIATSKGSLDRRAWLGLVVGFVIWAGFLIVHPILFLANPLLHLMR